MAIEDGRVVEIGPALRGRAPREIDAARLHIFPGGIDSHVHFNEPGRTDWETIAHGSRALAAGGYTCFIDMPLNSLPVTVDAAAFDLKRAALERSAVVDFGLWGGLVPGNVKHLGELVDRGVLGFKAFMCPSGVDEFPACDEATLRRGMARIVELGVPLLVHAEDPRLLRPPDGPSPADFIRSRPAAAELEAIRRVIELAADTGCRTHIVHVSTAAGLQLILAAAQGGVPVSCETCPHYLLYGAGDVERLGGLAKCAPPFRTAADREGLWDTLAGASPVIVVSDHSPSSPELKTGDDFRQIWGGISGCQSTRQLLLAEDRLPLARVAALTSTNVAARFRVEGKGGLAPGYDADLWLVDLAHEDVVRHGDLLYRHPQSAHEGRRIRGRTVLTLVRGEWPGRGRLIRAGER